MRTLLLLFLFSLPAQAAKPSFAILVKRRFDRAFYKISPEGKVWVCESNHYPYFEAPENPLAKMNWDALVKESKSRPKNCRELMAIENDLEGKGKRIVTCLSQKETQALYVRVSRLCRSKI